MTPGEFASLLGVHIATVYRWEASHSEPNISTMRDIADALETDPCSIFFGHQCETAA